MSYQVTEEVSNGASGVRHNHERNTSEFTQFPGSLWLARQLGETISTGHDTNFKDVDMLVQTRFDYEVLRSELTVWIESDPINTDY